MGFRLTRRAEQDLILLSKTGIRLFGVAQAKRYHDQMFDCFDLLSLNPEMARLRPELSSGMRIHPFRSHLIVYRIERGGEVLIVRIRHAREDWMSEPQSTLPAPLLTLKHFTGIGTSRSGAARAQFRQETIHEHPDRRSRHQQHLRLAARRQ